MSVSLPVDGPGDAELISAVRGGDVDAYGDLFARHVDSARRLARQLAGPADADDLVSDAFTKVLTVLQRGGGPDLAFRAYLLTAIRRLHVDKIRAGSRLRPVDDLTPFDPGLPFHDTAVEGFENAAAAKAFASLPERWQMVLWHTEVEQQKPADVAPLLGMSANSVSALAYRAREGLRQAFLSQHATDPDDVDCAWTRDHLGAYVRGGLSRRDAARVDDHLASCRSCAAVYLELTEVNSGLAGILAPLLLGSAGAGYLSSGSGAGSGLLSNGVTAAKTWAAAHASLTAIGGLLVTATAVASIYGATHLHSRDAADVGSPPVHSGSVTSTVGPHNGHQHGRHGRHDGPGRTGSNGPSGQTNGPTTTDSTPPVAPTSLPTDTTTGPSDPTSGATDPDTTTTGPTDTPTGPTTSPTGPTGGDQVQFTSTPPDSPAFGSTYRLHASSGSGKQITFSIGSDTTRNACSLDDAGTTVTFDHAGKCVIEADVAAKHADRNAGRGSGSTPAARSATSAEQRIVVPQEDQRIHFALPSAAQVGDQLSLDATSSSGLAVTYTSNDACVVNGAATRVTMLHALGCTVTAHQAGDGDYTEASDASQSVQVGQGTPVITFTSQPPARAAVDGQAYPVTATSTSGDPVTFTVDNATDPNNACEVTGNDDVVFHHAGTCSLTATDPGNADYLPASSDQQQFQIGRGTPTISFTSQPPAHAAVDGQAYPVTATSTSGDPVTFTVDNATDPNNACEVTGNDNVVFHHAGTCSLTATDPGNADYLPASSDQQQFQIGRGTPTISFTSQPPAHAAVDGQAYPVTATSTSGDPVTFTVDNATDPNNACEVTGNDDVVFHHAGTCSLTATDPGNADYGPATTQQQFQVGKGTQTISFTSSAPNDAVVGGTPYIVTATSSSGDPVTLDTDASSPNGACTLTGSTVSFGHAGTCTITASDPGNADYAPATAQQQFQVGKGTQVVTFTTQAPGHAVVDGATYTPSATSTSGDSLTLDTDASSPNGACTLKGGTVSFHHAGTCTITASDPGNADYAPATAQQQFQVGKGTQVVTFTTQAPGHAVVDGATYTPSATSTSGDSLTLDTDASSPNGACTLKGGTVSFHHAGTCTITASDPGNADYAPATAQQQFQVGKGTQVVTFTTQAPGHAVVDGATYTPSATSTSGDSLTLDTDASSPNGACTLKGGTVSFHHAGTCTITASDPGNADYAPATAQQQFQVGKGTQTITFTTQPPSAPAFGSTYPVSATGGASGNKVTFSIDAATSHSACTLAGSTVTFNHAGTCIVDADQAAAADYESAPRVQQVIVVPKVAQMITFTSTPPASPRVGDKYPVTATGGASGKPVTFSSTTPKVCTVSGSTVSFVALGGCSIAADQAGNDDYLAAPTLTQQVTIGGRDLTLSVTTRHGWLFSLFGTVVDVQVTGLDPGAHATLSMTADHALAWSPSECVGSRTQVTCSVDSTPTTLSFLALAFSDDASLNFTVSSSDSQDSDPGDNTASVPIGN